MPRATVATMTRLMDEFVTSLARCKQPKLSVLFNPWWRSRRQNFDHLFYGYQDMPIEAAKILMQYYESRGRLGQPVGTYPPGKIIFLRPLKPRNAEKEWDAVYIAPEDLIAEGLLVSPMMFHDHLCSTVYQALQQSLVNSERTENDNGEETVHRSNSLFGVIKNWSKTAYGGLMAFFSRPQAPIVSETRLESILLSPA